MPYGSDNAVAEPLWFLYIEQNLYSLQHILLVLLLHNPNRVISSHSIWLAFIAFSRSMLPYVGSYSLIFAVIALLWLSSSYYHIILCLVFRLFLFHFGWLPLYLDYYHITFWPLSYSMDLTASIPLPWSWNSVFYNRLYVVISYSHCHPGKWFSSTDLYDWNFVTLLPNYIMDFTILMILSWRFILVRHCLWYSRLSLWKAGIKQSIAQFCWL